MSLLIYNDLRIAEALTCDIEFFTYQRGHRVLRIAAQGRQGLHGALFLPRHPGPRGLHRGAQFGLIFLNEEETARLSHSTSYVLIRRLVGSPVGTASAYAGRISPHSLRYDFATEPLGAGVPCETSGRYAHADPRTTRRYNRSLRNLDRHPTSTMAAQRRRTAPDPA